MLRHKHLRYSCDNTVVDVINVMSDIISFSGLPSGELGIIYVHGQRRSVRINAVAEVYNPSFKLAKKEFSDLADDAVTNDVRQMITKGVFKIMKYGTDKRSEVMFQKKSNGTVKARLVTEIMI